MTGNIVKGKGFEEALEYNLEKVEQGQAEVLDHNFAEVEKNTIMKEVAYVKTLRPNLQKFFYHTSINFPPAETLTNDQMKQIAKEYLELNGFTQNQNIVFRHHDADHPHFHILANRIGYDGSVVSDSNDYARSQKALRQLETKYGLQQGITVKHGQERSITKNELEMMKRTNSPSGKIKLQAIIKSILKSDQKLSTADFIKALEAKGVHVKFNQASTGYISGISYRYEGFTTTGTKLGNNYKWSGIKSRIDYDPQRDRKITEATNQKQPSEIPKVTYQQRQSLTQSESLKEVFSKHHQLDFGLSSLLEAGPQGQAHNIGKSYYESEESHLVRKKKDKKKGLRQRW